MSHHPDSMSNLPPRGVPVHNWRAHWLTVAEFSRMLGREPQTVYKMLRLGTLSDFGVSVYSYRSGRKHSARLFIKNPYF